MIQFLRIIFQFFFESTSAKKGLEPVLKKIVTTGLLLILGLGCSKSAPLPSQRSSFQEKSAPQTAKTALPQRPVSTSNRTIEPNPQSPSIIKNLSLLSGAGSQGLPARTEASVASGGLVQEKVVAITAKAQDESGALGPSAPSSSPLPSASIDSFFRKNSAALPVDPAGSSSANFVFISSGIPAPNSLAVALPQKGDGISSPQGPTPTGFVPLVNLPAVGSQALAPALASVAPPSLSPSNLALPTSVTNSLPFSNSSSLTANPTLLAVATMVPSFAETPSNLLLPPLATITRSLPSLNLPGVTELQTPTSLISTTIPLATIPANILAPIPSTIFSTPTPIASDSFLQNKPLTTVTATLIGGLPTGSGATTPTTSSGPLPSIDSTTSALSGNTAVEVLQVNLSTSNYHPPTLALSPGSAPSGQPTEIQQGIEGGLRVALAISGQVSLPSVTSSNPCQGPFTTPPTVTVWEKKWGESDWAPSTDPQDKIYVDSWGIFSHLFQFTRSAYSDDCADRSVKLKIAYDLDGKHFETETAEMDCKSSPNQLPPPQTTLPETCHPPTDEEPLVNRLPQGKFSARDIDPDRINSLSTVNPF